MAFTDKKQKRLCSLGYLLFIFTEENKGNEDLAGERPVAVPEFWSRHATFAILANWVELTGKNTDSGERSENCDERGEDLLFFCADTHV